MTPEIHAWCGIDVSKKTMDVSLVIDQPLQAFSKVPVAQFSRTQQGVNGLLHWLTDRLTGTHISLDEVGFVMEATGNYSIELYSLLRDRDLAHVSIVNPRLVSNFIKSLGLRSKTDRIDGRALGFYGKERTPTTHEPMTPEYQRLRDLVRYRRTLVNERTALVLRLSSAQDPFVIRKLKSRIKSQDKWIQDCEKEIKKTVAGSETLSRDIALLQTMVGVGPVTAWTVLGELGDLRRFKKSRQLSSLAGLAPHLYESGTSVKRNTRLSKDCGKATREVLYMAALAAAHVQDTSLSAFYQRLLKGGKNKKSALCAVMRKMLVIMRAMMINETPFKRSAPPSVENLRKNQAA